MLNLNVSSLRVIRRKYWRNKTCFIYIRCFLYKWLGAIFIYIKLNLLINIVKIVNVINRNI